MDEVDTDPVSASADFSDGTTSGTITDPGDQLMFVADAIDPGQGVVIISSSRGGPTPASISACGGNSLYSVGATEHLIITC